MGWSKPCCFYGQVFVLLISRALPKKSLDVLSPSWPIKERYCSCEHGFEAGVSYYWCICSSFNIFWRKLLQKRGIIWWQKIEDLDERRRGLDVVDSMCKIGSTFFPRLLWRSVALLGTIVGPKTIWRTRVLK